MTTKRFLKLLSNAKLAKLMEVVESKGWKDLVKNEMDRRVKCRAKKAARQKMAA